MTYMRAILREEGSPLFLVFFYLNKRNTTCDGLRAVGDIWLSDVPNHCRELP